MSEMPGLSPEHQLLAGLARLGQAIRIEAWRNAGPHNLSPLQADIIAHLDAGGRPRRQGELVQALASTPPTVSDAVKVMRGKGLVEGTRDPTDARVVLVRLTDEGQAEAQRLSIASVTLTDAIATLSGPDFASMLRSTTAIMRELQARHAIPISRMCLTCRFFEPSAHQDDPDRPHHCHFVDAPFGDAELRVVCPDHQPAES
jgi:DNA-binding MarR family transcriptional regulator